MDNTYLANQMRLIIPPRLLSNYCSDIEFIRAHSVSIEEIYRRDGTLSSLPIQNPGMLEYILSGKTNQLRLQMAQSEILSKNRTII